MKDARVLSVGSISVEFRVRVSRWPEPGETLHARDFGIAGGGRGAMVALIARQLQAKAECIGRVGEDALAELALAPLRDASVALDGTRQVRGVGTGVAIVWLRPERENAVLSSPNANTAWTAEDADLVERSILAAPAGSVLVPDLELPALVVERAIREAKRRSLPVVLHPRPVEALSEELLGCLDFVTPNSLEASQLTNVDVEDPKTALEAARRLVARGVRAVAVRLEGQGVLFSDGAEHHFIEPVSIAGSSGSDPDAFDAALSVALLDGMTSRQAVEFASAAAALYACRRGMRPTALLRRDIERLMASDIA